MSSAEYHYNTLKSLSGLRVSVGLSSTLVSAADICVHQYERSMVELCDQQQSAHIETMTTSVFYQGINVTLVQLNETAWGRYNPRKRHFLSSPQQLLTSELKRLDGLLSHAGTNVDAYLTAWTVTYERYNRTSMITTLPPRHIVALYKERKNIAPGVDLLPCHLSKFFIN